MWNAETGEAALEPFMGHTDTVLSIAFSSDGQRIISGSKDNTVRVWKWNPETVEQGIELFEGHTGWVRSVAISASGKRIASGSDDTTIQVWNAETGEMLECFGRHMDGIQSVAFSPDGQRIISGSQDHTVRVWNAQTGKEILGPLYGHMSWVKSVAFSPDGRQIASGSDDHTVRVWDVEEVSEFPGGHSQVEYAITSPDPISRENQEATSIGFFHDSKFVDGWMYGRESELLFWVPPSNRRGLWWPYNTVVIGKQTTRLIFHQFVHGTAWTHCRQP
jgi:WD40 repeat protein